MDLFEEWNATEKRNSQRQQQQQQQQPRRPAGAQQFTQPGEREHRQGGNAPLQQHRGRSSQPGGNAMGGGGGIGLPWGKRQPPQQQPAQQQSSASVTPAGAPSNAVGNRLSAIAPAAAQPDNPFGPGTSTPFASNPFASSNPFGVGANPARAGAGRSRPPLATGFGRDDVFGEPSSNVRFVLR